ncbi:MAG: rod shape-determining protein MreD [Pseudomonadota bacterium]
MSSFSLSERFEWVWRFLLAHTVTLSLFFLALVSFAIPYAGQVKPYFLLMPIYFWSIYRPALVPPLFLLLIGVMFDLISGQSYLGLTAFILLAAQWVIKDQ